MERIKRNRTRYRLIYMLDTPFATLKLGINAATLQRATIYGEAERA